MQKRSAPIPSAERPLPHEHVRANWAETQSDNAQAGTALFVRAMTPADAHRTAHLQLAGLPRSFVAQLGARFLQALHIAFLRSPHVVGLVAVDAANPDSLLGFAIGSTDARRHAAHVLQASRIPLATVGVRSLLAHPNLLPRFVRRRASRYVRRLFGARRGKPATPVDSRPLDSAAAPTGATAVITALVVAPTGRRRGTGTALAEAFVTAATAAGSARIMLVTRADETGAAAFWKRLGWQEIDVHQNLDGDLVASMSRELP